MPSFSSDESTNSFVVLKISLLLSFLRSAGRLSKEYSIAPLAFAGLPGVHPKDLAFLLIHAAILFLVAAENFDLFK